MDKIQVKVSYMVRWGLQGVTLEKDTKSLKNMDLAIILIQTMNVEEIDDVAELEFELKSYKIKVKGLVYMEEEQAHEKIMEIHNQFFDDQPLELATTAEAGNDKEINTDRANDSDWIGEYNSRDVCF